VKAEEEVKKAEREKAEASRKALADQMAQVLSVRFVDVKLHKASFRDFDVESYVRFAIEFNNMGSKTITGMKGIANFKDKFGDTISELPIKVEQKLPAGEKVIIILSKRFNQFEPVDRTLANLDTATTSFTVSPEVVLFSDGSKFEAPKAKD